MEDAFFHRLFQNKHPFVLALLLLQGFTDKFLRIGSQFFETSMESVIS